MRAERPPLRVLESGQLTLVAATRELVAADLGGRAELSAALGAEVPEQWPPELFSTTVMHLVMDQLQDPAEHGWSAWYLLRRENGVSVLVGMCQFKGRPDVSARRKLHIPSWRSTVIAVTPPRRSRAW